ncbi:MAG: hypothetical protein ACYC3V_06830 [Chloroflexota bacterium]
MRPLLTSLIIAAAVALVVVESAAAQPKPEFKLGFAALAAQIPAIIGGPLENEHWGSNGDSLQQTGKGLMVWRKADNWTAFTDGNRTWINGPMGLQNRFNNERFSWEPSAPGTNLVGVGSQEKARSKVLEWLARNPQFRGWVWPDGVLRREPMNWEEEARGIEQDEKRLESQDELRWLREQENQRLWDEMQQQKAETERRLAQELERERLRQAEELRQQAAEQRRQAEQLERERLQRLNPVVPYQPPAYEPPPPVYQPPSIYTPPSPRFP